MFIYLNIKNLKHIVIFSLENIMILSWYMSLIYSHWYFCANTGWEASSLNRSVECLVSWRTRAHGPPWLAGTRSDFLCRFMESSLVLVAVSLSPSCVDQYTYLATHSCSMGFHRLQLAKEIAEIRASEFFKRLDRVLKRATSPNLKPESKLCHSGRHFENR